jgi:putative phosphoesterase
MNIGILSDSHGNIARTRAAIAALKPYAPVHVIHCGDIGTNAVLDELAAGFAEPEVPVTCVLGNVDSWEGDLFSPVSFVRIEGRLAKLELGGKKIAVIHGDESVRLRALITNQTFDFIFTGHTHLRSDERQGRTRIINPGALHRAAQPGCAALDLNHGNLTYLDLH